MSRKQPFSRTRAFEFQSFCLANKPVIHIDMPMWLIKPSVILRKQHNGPRTVTMVTFPEMTDSSF